MKVKQRDIILIPFPFSDLSAVKVRPALVISNDPYNTANLDAVIVAITSNRSPHEYKVLIDNQDLETGSLPTDSAVRVDKPFSILQIKVLKIQGTLGSDKFDEVRAAIAKLVSIKSSESANPTRTRKPAI